MTTATVTAASTSPLLEARGLRKRFFGALALDGACFSLAPGEIHALVGENGAGKSTFIKILAGVYDIDEGEILLDGQPVNPARAALPIAFVHQDLALVDDLSVAENVALVAGYPKRGGLINWSAVHRQSDAVYDALGLLPVDPERLVVTLSAAEKAILGIARTLAQRPRVLVLDEPTAALPERDAMRLFEAMRKLRETGTAIIYVSHRLNELIGLADRVTVFRDGRHVHTGRMADTPPQALVEHMLGRAVDLTRQPKTAGQATGSARDRAVLQVENLVIERRGPLSFEARPHEILGLVGLRGGGQEAVGRTLFGARKADSGSITLLGRELPPTDTIADRIAAGIVLLAGDRTGESTFAGMTLTENLFVNARLKGGSVWRFVQPAQERREADLRLEAFDVRPRRQAALIDWLSGGNQQKVCIARWLEAGAPVVILEEPTAGVDIGAKLAIYELLRKAAADGAAVIVISSDIDEVSTLCNRALIINRGRVASELVGEEVNVDELIARSSLGTQDTEFSAP